MTTLTEGFLSRYFERVFIKRLSVVETDTMRSNQHELNGISPLRILFGDTRSSREAYFIWLGEENEGITELSSITWYDARANHPTRTEFRLYYKANSVMDIASDGDLLIVAQRSDESIYFMVAPAESTIERQLIWLFNIKEQIGTDFIVQEVKGRNDAKIDFVVRYILDEIGIEIAEAEESLLDELLEHYFDGGFPSTKEFSALARKITCEYSETENPDNALLSWMESEERLFRRLEKHLVSKELQTVFSSGGTINIENFLSVSKSIHNRRKSRVGRALENHLSFIFTSIKILHSRNPVTENRSRPDFIFPGYQEYSDPVFPKEDLTMLGVKFSCRDRWRQIISEAIRIPQKHLLTLEPGISEAQTREMKTLNVQLVIPQPLHATYSVRQMHELLNLHEFIRLVRQRQVHQIR